MKTQPRSKEAEEAVLGSIIREGNVIYERCAGWIRQSDAFYYKNNRVIWDEKNNTYDSKKAQTCFQKFSGEDLITLKRRGLVISKIIKI